MQEPDARTNEITGCILDAAIHVHRTLGNGLLESAYEICLAHVLEKRGISVERQVPMPLTFEGIDLGTPYKLDLLVERRVVAELKAVTKMIPIYEAQLLSYLKLGNYHVGILINFHEATLKSGFKRMLNPAWKPAP